MLTQAQSLDHISLCERDLMLCEDAEHSTQDDFLRAFDKYQQAKDWHQRQFGASTNHTNQGVHHD